ncbi:hypothetical protein SAMN05444358_12011 [Ruegeria halocynthiae]|uniref:Transposase n=1 Tax=Ruegeria halocynthiae TaxID=985054 RepID=A0A1H3FZZ2_9RHOB|nr:hypothetical protein [Ruegeria halocynthiae]SDX95744.1 hypothetical protein SAMN05444358_12011 [Ruegeria halocynthiae]
MSADQQEVPAAKTDRAKKSSTAKIFGGYPLSYRDVVDLLSERGISVDRSTVYRWVTKFGPEITKRTEK